MKQFLTIVCLFGATFYSIAQERLRVAVLSDIENEPDDAESFVRLLVYSNMWDIEGLIATTSIHQKNKIADWRMHEIVTAYGKVRNNLLKHEAGFPEEKYLHSVIKKGFADYGMKAVGEGKDSEGSELLISLLEKKDNRPLWVTVWGGTNCLAQALWKLKMNKDPNEVSKLVSKLRVYTISDQDDSGVWIRKNYPELFYIVSPGMTTYAYHYSTWAGISGDVRHKFNGPDSTIVSNQWLNENVRFNHGPLGEQYPEWKFLMEGDTPSFLYLVSNGLNNPEHPDWGSWGGRYELYIPRQRKWMPEPETRPIWSNTEDEVKGYDGRWYISDKATVWRWREAYQNDFAARMDWCVNDFKNANHPPIPIVPNKIISVSSGDTVYMNASKSYDPDSNSLSYNWMHYKEVGSYGMTENSVRIANEKNALAWFVAPSVNKSETLHIILSVTDNGKPALTRYQRIIVTIIP
ncbi:DUF1593 domain-containing protein [Lacibacter luteus]|nr:DUF1593 domain-containing protein [Lacibacter luteus]